MQHSGVVGRRMYESSRARLPYNQITRYSWLQNKCSCFSSLAAPRARAAIKSRASCTARTRSPGYDKFLLHIQLTMRRKCFLQRKFPLKEAVRWVVITPAPKTRRHRPLRNTLSSGGCLLSTMTLPNGSCAFSASSLNPKPDRPPPHDFTGIRQIRAPLRFSRPDPVELFSVSRLTTV